MVRAVQSGAFLIPPRSGLSLIHIFYDVYEGNRNDAKEFPQVLEKFQRWLKERAGSTWATIKPTLIFDKGNNSKDNFALVDACLLYTSRCV